MDLSVIIVNWKSLEFAKHCIASLLATLHELEYEIIVVDNASEDCSEISAMYPEVRLINSEHNVGFAGANNLGFANSSGDKLLFLNPDTLVLPNAVLRMALILDAEPQLGAVGCRLLNPDLTLQMNSTQRFPTIMNQLLSINFIRRHWPRLPMWGMQGLFSDKPYEVFDVDVVSGACLMVKRDVFESVGCFSRDYFMYAEEVDLCWKIVRAGYKVCHASHARVVHFGGQSTKSSSNASMDIAMRKSVFTFLCKSRGTLYATLYRMTLVFSAALRLTLLTLVLAVLNWRGARSRTIAIRAFKKWANVAQWALAIRA